MPKVKDLLEYVYPIRRKADAGIDADLFHSLLDDAFGHGISEAHRLCGSKMPIIVNASRVQWISLLMIGEIGQGTARALHAAFMFALGMRLPMSAREIGKARILALAQSIRSLSLALMNLTPPAAQPLWSWRPKGLDGFRWESQCRGASAEAHVASAVLASSLPCLYPDPRFDSWGWTDLLCGPFNDGRGLYLQVKSGRDLGFKASVINGRPAHDAERRKQLMRAWHGARKFNESFGISWLPVMVEAGPSPESAEASMAADLALGEDLRRIITTNGFDT